MLSKDSTLFKDSFELFVEIGEERLGRKLMSSERSDLINSYYIYCKEKNESDLATEIYKLTLSKLEKENGPVGIIDKARIKNSISKKYNAIKISENKANSELSQDMASNFASISNDDWIFMSYARPDTTHLAQRRKKLKLDFESDFNYKAPRSKVKPIIAAILAGVIVGGYSIDKIKDLFPADSTPKLPTTSQVDSSTQKYNSELMAFLQKDVNSMPLSHFKSIYAEEYHLNNARKKLNASDLKIKGYTYPNIIKISKPNSTQVGYISPAQDYSALKSILKKAGLEIELVSNSGENSNVDVCKVLNASNETIDNVALFNGDKLALLGDGDDLIKSPSKISELIDELNSTPDYRKKSTLVSFIETNPDLINILANSKKQDYVQFLAKYIEQNPNSMYSQKSREYIKENQTTKISENDIEFD